MGEREIAVYGGAGGTTANLTDLEHATGALARAVDSLEALRWELSVASTVARAAASASPASAQGAAWRAVDATDAALAGPMGVRVAAEDVEWVSGDLHRAVAAYLTSEAAAAASLSLAERAMNAHQDAGATVRWGSRVAATGVWELTTPGMVLSFFGIDPIGPALWPDGPPPTTGYLNDETAHAATAAVDLIPGAYRGVAAFLAGLVARVEQLLGEPSALELPPVRSVSDLPPPHGLEDLLWTVDGVYQDDRGAVGIQELVQSDGSSAYIVYIPGTEDGVSADRNPFDVHADLSLMAEKGAESADLVVRAMEDAGIPPDAAVMMVGHSQGGIIAAGLAAAPAVQKRFRVTHVVTAGAPTGRFTLPPSVTALHVEHVEDATSGVDAKRNLDSPSVVTVRRELRASADPATADQGRYLLDSHLLSTFADTASIADATAHPSVASWRDGARPFLGEPASSTYTEYSVGQPPGAQTPSREAASP